MRKFVISLAAAAAALAVASPAAAQYYPGQPYGHANDYGNPYFNSARALQHRIDALEYRIDRVGWRQSSRGLREESRNLERRLHIAARNGLNPYEANDIANRIAQLEQRVSYAMQRGGYGRYGYTGYNGYNGQNGYYGDRDRDDHDYDRDDDHHGYDRDDD